MSFQSTPSNFTPDGTPRLRLLGQMRETNRRKYYSRRTGERMSIGSSGSFI